MVPIPNAMARVIIRLWNPFLAWVASDRLVVCSSLIAKNNILRNSHIDITCAKRICSQPMRNPAPVTRGYEVVWASVTTCRIAPARGQVQVTMVTKVVCIDYLCTTLARYCTICVCLHQITRKWYAE